MIHLRLIVPSRLTGEVLDHVLASPAVTDVVHLPGAAREPVGDLILCDVAREEASVIIGELKRVGVARTGSISMEEVDTCISDAADRAKEAAVDLPFGDQVVWEEIEARTSEETSVSINFVEFMMIAALIAATGILLDSPILIVGAMVVGPEFGPLAGICVALVERRTDLARRSVIALAVGFLAAITVTVLAVQFFRWSGISPRLQDPHPLTLFISHPDIYSFLVAYLAGTAGVISLTSAKSGALIGVLISVTTIPAAANVGVAAAYGDWTESSGAALQLGVNLLAIVLGGVARLYVQRRVWLVRQRRHQRKA
jgi:uncharacterized hydrophobic protein (TIGR00271 family)